MGVFLGCYLQQYTPPKLGKKQKSAQFGLFSVRICRLNVDYTSSKPFILSCRLSINNNGSGGPDRIWTCDPSLRRRVLYPAELRDHFYPSTAAFKSPSVNSIDILTSVSPSGGLPSVSYIKPVRPYNPFLTDFLVTFSLTAWGSLRPSQYWRNLCTRLSRIMGFICPRGVFRHNPNVRNLSVSIAQRRPKHRKRLHVLFGAPIYLASVDQQLVQSCAANS